MTHETTSSSVMSSNLVAQTVPPPSQLLPTVTQLSRSIASHLGSPCRKDVDFIYHNSRNPPQRQAKENPPRFGIRNIPTDHTPVSKIILSITPTPGVYTEMNAPSLHRPAVFLHRPFNLDRKRVPRGTVVLASHVAFDEVLTVGYNTVLATRLHVDIPSSVCLQGYKGDADRRIGIVGILDSVRSLRHIVADIEREFQSVDSVHGFSLENVEGTGDGEEEVKVVAIMNAFHPEEVDRVVEAAIFREWIQDPNDASHILYLTGQAREPGLEAAKKKNIKIVCVGHRTCEEWGIRHLAGEVRKEFPAVDVVEIFEDEEPLPPRPRKPAQEGNEQKTKKLKMTPAVTS